MSPATPARDLGFVGADESGRIAPCAAVALSPRTTGAGEPPNIAGCKFSAGDGDVGDIPLAEPPTSDEAVIAALEGGGEGTAAVEETGDFAYSMTPSARPDPLLELEGAAATMTDVEVGADALVARMTVAVAGRAIITNCAKSTRGA